jgi:hypothetical protein
MAVVVRGATARQGNTQNERVRCHFLSRAQSIRSAPDMIRSLMCMKIIIPQREIDRREEGSGGAKLNQIAVDTFPKINYPSRFLPCGKLTCKLPPLCGLTGHKHPDGKKLPGLLVIFWQKRQYNRRIAIQKS